MFTLFTLEAEASKIRDQHVHTVKTSLSATTVLGSLDAAVRTC
jgi:hypothetical protein